MLLPNLFISFFSRVSQSSSVVFYMFSFWFEFFKSTRVLPNLIYNICEIFIDFFPISSSLSSSWIKLFRPESECSSSDSLLVPKILFTRQFTVIMGRHPVIIFMFWFITTGPFLGFFPLISLTSRGISINFLFSLSLPYCSSKSFFGSDDSSELALPSSDCLSFLNFSPLASALEHKCIRKKLKAII